MHKGSMRISQSELMRVRRWKNAGKSDVETHDITGIPFRKVQYIYSQAYEGDGGVAAWLRRVGA